jgi:hypothetical protein
MNQPGRIPAEFGSHTACRQSQIPPIVPIQSPSRAGSGRCHQFEKTKPIFAVFGPRTRVGAENEAKRSQFERPVGRPRLRIAGLGLRIPRQSAIGRTTRYAWRDTSHGARATNAPNKADFSAAGGRGCERCQGAKGPGFGRDPSTPLGTGGTDLEVAKWLVDGGGWIAYDTMYC